MINRTSANAMASGVRDLLSSDIGIGITGVAGPDEEESQPVGTVYVGISYRVGHQSTRLDLHGDPHGIRWAATDHALGELRYAQKVMKAANGDEAPPTQRLVVPVGGFALESHYPLVEAGISGSRLCFTVEGNHSKTASFGIVPLNGERPPEVLLSATNCDPTSHGRVTGEGARLFEVPRGTKLSLTWNPPNR